MKITTLIPLLLLLFLNGCITGWKIQSGPKFEASTNYKNYRKEIYWYDEIILQDGEKIYFKKPIGSCGGGISLLFIVDIPIPLEFISNTCDKEFVMKIWTSDTKDIRIKLKYNNIIYEASEVLKINQNSAVIKFKINMKELLDSENKAIIVKKANLTQELPFEWGQRLIYSWG